MSDTTQVRAESPTHGTAGHRPHTCTCGLLPRLVESHDRRISTRWGRFLYWVMRKTT